jgi:hypothetical protein
MLGSEHKLKWNRSAGSLTIRKPKVKPCDFACALKVSLA